VRRGLQFWRYIKQVSTKFSIAVIFEIDQMYANFYYYKYMDNNKNRLKILCWYVIPFALHFTWGTGNEFIFGNKFLYLTLKRNNMFNGGQLQFIALSKLIFLKRTTKYEYCVTYNLGLISSPKTAFVRTVSWYYS
jgi:hypothetical protein